MQSIQLYGPSKVGSTIVSPISSAHCTAAHVLVSAAGHDLISDTVQEEFCRLHTIRPRNMTFKRWCKEEYAGVEPDGRKEEAEAKRD